MFSVVVGILTVNERCLSALLFPCKSRAELEGKRSQMFIISWPPRGGKTWVSTNEAAFA